MRPASYDSPSPSPSSLPSSNNDSDILSCILADNDALRGGIAGGGPAANRVSEVCSCFCGRGGGILEMAGDCGTVDVSLGAVEGEEDTSLSVLRNLSLLGNFYIVTL